MFRICCSFPGKAVGVSIGGSAAPAQAEVHLPESLILSLLCHELSVTSSLSRALSLSSSGALSISLDLRRSLHHELSNTNSSQALSLSISNTSLCSPTNLSRVLSLWSNSHILCWILIVMVVSVIKHWWYVADSSSVRWVEVQCEDCSEW